MHKLFIEKMHIGQTYLIRMMPGDDIFKGIKDFCLNHHIKRAVILSSIGSAKDIVFRDLLCNVKAPLEISKTNEIKQAGPFEVLSLEGNIFPMEDETIVHLHVLLGREDGSVCGGHLIQANVFTTLELVIAEIKDSGVFRKKSQDTGLNELMLEES